MAREHGNIHRSDSLDAAALVRLLERCDAIRKPQRMADVLLAVLAVVQQVATNVIATRAIETGATGPKVGQLIHQARVAAVQASLALTVAQTP